MDELKMLKILLSDKTASGTRVPINFIISLLNTDPEIEPENFKIPVLLVHPEFDEWTPVWISKLFFDRIMGEKELKILNKAGHFPIEKPGIDQLPVYVEEFIDRVRV